MTLGTKDVLGNFTLQLDSVPEPRALQRERCHRMPQRMVVSSGFAVPFTLAWVADGHSHMSPGESQPCLRFLIRSLPHLSDNFTMMFTYNIDSFGGYF